jgi:hypothetical protein
VVCQRYALAALPLGKRPGTYYAVGWVGPRAGVGICVASRYIRSQLTHTHTLSLSLISPRFEILTSVSVQVIKSVGMTSSCLVSEKLAATTFSVVIGSRFLRTNGPLKTDKAGSSETLVPI